MEGLEYPTVGISFGLSSIYEIMKSEVLNSNSNIDVFIIPMETEIESLKISNIIRENGYNVEIEMNNKKLKKSLDYANNMGIKYVIIIGTNEIESENITIKNMIDGTSETIKISDIINYNFR